MKRQPHLQGKWIFNKVGKIIQWGKDHSFFQQVVLEGLGPARGSHVKTQPCLHGKWIFNTVGKIIQWEKDHSFFLTSGARRLGASHVQENTMLLYITS